MKVLAYGTKVKDEITGIEGKVTGCSYFYDKDSMAYRVDYIADNQLQQVWFPVERLVVVKQ